uniref:DUF4283 domain-containing protein n=1 Tax=Fagus sylvatica TaxID=28930 RepID=A0A2N9FWN1_FAGSY
MESLETQWEKFTLSEVEGDTADLVSTTKQPKSYLAAKFLTRRALNAEAVARTFTPLWRTDHGFTIRDMNENRLVFIFEDEADRERVMMGEPWAYDKHLVVLQRIEEEEAIRGFLGDFAVGAIAWLTSLQNEPRRSHYSCLLPRTN